jgi:hypothetical protein
MENLIQYRYNCEKAIFKYFVEKDIDDLIAELKRNEEHYKQQIECTNNEMGMWFRFGSDDSLANTIDDIERDLNLSKNHPNHKHLIDRFLLVIGNNPQAELLIHFS